MKEYIVHITAHVYSEEELVDDLYLFNSSPDCGILGPEVIIPLRKANGASYIIESDSDLFSVRDLWDWIDCKLYAEVVSPYFDSVLQFIHESRFVRKYLCFNGYRYSVEEWDKPLEYYLNRMGKTAEQEIEVQLLVSANAGDVCRDDGIRYYMNSREAGSHNIPHVHVDVCHKDSGTFSLLDGSQLSGDVKAKDRAKIKAMIHRHQQEWLVYWNEHTDGLNIDLNQVLGLIRY